MTQRSRAALSLAARYQFMVLYATRPGPTVESVVVMNIRPAIGPCPSPARSREIQAHRSIKAKRPPARHLANQPTICERINEN